ncbi:hypothetical protein [Synechococcus sp. CBW1107]|uniref:tetratricopeptide repeat protein n=1 Tax=Synechococcus sp. CBW1107 TaxID=2789857 RepID=UPI002AD500B9|nr:hypothetical protein [Synechococcus sp. CBW1107]CAK6697927.1 hypothetical protein IFHNHDMJ_02328 [Synechococcus sp. CBW1107]
MTSVPLETIEILIAYKKFELALPLLDEHLQGEEASPYVLYLLAQCLREIGRAEEAISAYQLCTLLDSNPYKSFVCLADILRDEDRLEESLSAGRAAIECSPQSCEALASSSLTLSALERFDEAEQMASLACRISPSYPQAWHSLALVKMYLNSYAESEAAYNVTIKLKPEWQLPRMERGMLHFMMGRLSEGVDDYEARWLIEGAPPKRHGNIQAWDCTPFEGYLLLWGEQGIGDEIFFLGLLPAVLKLHRQVVLEIDSRLRILASRSFPNVLVVEKGSVASLPFAIDRALPLGSLLKELTLAGAMPTLPLGGYLKAATTSRSNLCTNSPRIGIFWRSSRVKLGRSKSVDLMSLAPLACIDDSKLISLQYGDAREEIVAFRDLTGVEIDIPSFDLYSNIDILAELISSCDLIVSIPGVPAHLANSLGVDVYVISRSPRGRLWYWNHNAQGSWFSHAYIQNSTGFENVEQLVEGAVKDIKKKRSTRTS